VSNSLATDERMSQAGVMTMDPIPDVNDLVRLFESEPMDDEGGPWSEYYPYASVRFETTRDDNEVVFSFNPGYEDGRLTVRRAGDVLVDLTLRGVQAISVDRLHQEALVLSFRSDDVRDLRLTLKPVVRLNWGSEDRGFSLTRS
jgi:hypothetical protein